MPLQVNYTDESGVNHPESYWKLLDVLSIDRVNSRAVFQLKGYHSKATMEAGKKPIANLMLQINNDKVKQIKKVNGQTVIENGVPVIEEVNKTDFTDYLLTEALNPEGENPYKKAYEFAKAKIAIFNNAIDVDL